MRRALLAILGTAAALVMLLSFKTHNTSLATSPAAISTPNPGSADSSSSSTSSSGSSSSGSSSSKSSSSKSSSKSASSAAKSSSAATTKTVTGDAVDTQYGPVQVKITVSNGKVTAATAIEYPQNDPRDAQINSYAIPILNQEAVKASTAQIDNVSGATYTSQGYLQSLQSALDRAGL